MSSVPVYIDTNCFLHLRDLQELPWGEILPEADHVAIQVAPIIVSELDKHKNGTNDRRRNRSRRALKLIDRASEEPEDTLVLREQNPKVTLTVARRPPRSVAADLELDFDSPDDQLVVSTFWHGSQVTLLSNDSGPRLAARRAELKAMKPPTSWLLAEEPSDDKKTIGRLESELRRYFLKMS